MDRFHLLGDGDQRQATIAAAQRCTRDFSRIRCGDDSALFTPAAATARVARHAAWVDAQLDTAHQGPTLAMTHHAPSPRSVHRHFAGSALNACPLSDAEHLIGAA